MTRGDTADAPYNFSLNTQVKVTRHFVGEIREPVLVFDDVLREPDSMVRYASEKVEFLPAWTPDGGYPGIRAAAPLDHVNQLVRALTPTIVQGFGLRDVAPARAECSYCMVTLRPEQLKPQQTIPHVDTTDPLQFAFLHFLCDSSFGGTSFYRHRSTGLEVVTPEQLQPYTRRLNTELSENPPAQDYIRDTSALFEKIHSVKARWNRLLVYRSALLHSGTIPPHASLSDKPATGRLTANIFVNYGPTLSGGTRSTWLQD